MKAVFFCAPRPMTGPYLDDNEKTIIKTTLPINRKYFESTVLYTPFGTRVDPDLGFDEVIPLFFPYQRLTHFMRVVTWVHYLESNLFDSNTIFLDYDIVLNRSIDEIFDHDFALAFSAMPAINDDDQINSGCILAKHSGKEKAIFHAKKIRDIASEQKFEKDVRYPGIPFAGVWGGDEKCINTYLAIVAEAKQRTLPEVAASVGFDEFLPLTEDISIFGSKYNAKAHTLDMADWGRPSVLHFAGSHNKASVIAEYCKTMPSHS